MIDVADAQTDGARLLAVFAQGRADALAEILDQAAEKFRVDGAAFDGGFAGNGFWRGGQQHFAAIEAAGALPDLLADNFAESGLQRRLGHLAQFPDGGDAALGQRSGVDVADAVEFFRWQRRQEIFFFAGRDDAKAARALQPRSDGGDHFGARRANRNIQAGAAEYLRLQTPQRGFVIGVKAAGTGKVEVKIVQRGGFDSGRVGFQYAAHALRKIGVVLVLSGDDDGLRADAQRFAEAHRCFHAEELRFVARRSHAAAPHQHGLAAQFGIEHLLDRRKKRVHIHVDNVGNAHAVARAIRPEVFLFTGSARSQPGPGGPGIFRCRWFRP